MSSFLLLNRVYRREIQSVMLVFSTPFRLSEFRFEPFGKGENARNTVPWKKNRSKHSEFRSEACLGQKYAVYSVWWSKIFCKTHAIFFRSKPRN